MIYKYLFDRAFQQKIIIIIILGIELFFLAYRKTADALRSRVRRTEQLYYLSTVCVHII
jgi:hypothetical protein